MKTDTEIKMAGLEILHHGLGIVEAEKFVALIQRERFDYTKWRNVTTRRSSSKIRKVSSLTRRRTVLPTS